LHAEDEQTGCLFCTFLYCIGVLRVRVHVQLLLCGSKNEHAIR